MQQGGDARQRLERLEQIGKNLRLALELSGKAEPGTLGHRAAWGWAEQATLALGELVRELPLGPVVQASAVKLGL